MAEIGKSYKKEMNHSYTLGAAPTMELLATRPELALHLYISRSFIGSPTYYEIELLAKQHHIPLTLGDKAISRLSPKENVFVIGAFTKYTMQLEAGAPHIVLVNPADMGNFGTILRSALGFGLRDIAVIRPGVDCFHPRAIRSSMGALFKINCAYYESFTSYAGCFPNHDVFPFMMDGSVRLQNYSYTGSLYSLVFGNEATGLDKSYLLYGTSLRIGHSTDIDSLNLSNAASIAIYAFTKK